MPLNLRIFVAGKSASEAQILQFHYFCGPKELKEKRMLLDFEKPIAELETKLADMKQLADDSDDTVTRPSRLSRIRSSI